MFGITIVFIYMDSDFPLIPFPSYLLSSSHMESCALIIPVFGIDIFMVLARYSTAKSGEQREISKGN